MPSISRMLFAEDSLIFYISDLVENNNLLKLLALYERFSDQSINKEKTALTFSINVSRATQHAIMELWGTQET